MLAGAVGFAISLVAFNQQVLCLFGSTAMVFLGLGVHLLGRRSGQPLREAGEEEPVSTRAPRREAYRGAQPRPQVSAPSTWTQIEEDHREQTEPPARYRPVPPPQGRRLTAVADRAVELFRQDGAGVQVDIQREDRSLWHVTSASGRTYSVMVYEGDEVIDIGDLRALYSLMVNTGTEGGIFLAASSYTTRAQEWAEQRAIRLYDAASLPEITL
jgi:hypothetical protein